VADTEVGAEVAAHALGSLSQVAHHHKLAGRNLFPFYVLPKSVEGYSKLKDALKLQHTDIIAINARRGWWRKLPVKSGLLAEGDVSEQAIEAWVDSIRLGEGTKERLPEGLVPEEPVVEEPAAEEEAAPVVEEEKPIILEDVHDEL
jgi:protein disulfide-isomerase A6